MKKIIILLIIGLVSCGEGSNSKPDKVSTELEKSKSVTHLEKQNSLNLSNQKFVDSKYVYSDPTGQNIIIENSYPRGGLKYTNPIDEEYVYAIFWTRITNETNKPFEFSLEFSKDSYELPSSPGRLFKLLIIPSESETPEKEPLYLNWPNLKEYLDQKFPVETDLAGTIKPMGSNSFYIVTLFNKGVDGTLRTGLSANEKNLFYRINDKVIKCGHINLKLKQ